jgi:tripartite-type tricarboxylate transporter receptor subunit TctC
MRPQKLTTLPCALLIASSSVVVVAQTQAANTCKTVKFVVPYAPGGSSEVLARMMVPGISKLLDVKLR